VALLLLFFLSPLPLFISLGVEEIFKIRGFKVKVKVLNKMYTHKIPKIWKYINVVSVTAKINKATSIIL
jgi:hypothetical protein